MSNRNIVAEPNQHSIVATCTFDAPRDLVFKIMNDPELLTEWWGPKECTTVADKWEVRPGGLWRCVVKNSKGQTWPFHGVYHSVEEPTLLVYTSEYENVPGQVSLELVTFEDHEGGTKVTQTSVYQSVEARDSMIESGMTEDGLWMDRFAELLEKLQVTV